MPFLLTVRLAADDGHPTPLRQARVTAYALKQPVVLKSDGTQLVHQPESALTDDTGHATLTLYRSSEVLTPSDWAVTIDGVTWSGPVPESPDTASSILEMVESYGWGIIAAPKTAPVVAVTGPAGPAIDGLSSDGASGIDVVGNVDAASFTKAGSPLVTGLPLALVTVTDDYTVLLTDQTILVGASGKTITLPDASTVPAGYAFDVKNTTAGDTTTVATVAGNIDGVATYTGLAAAKAAVRCVSDGTDFWVL